MPNRVGKFVATLLIGPIAGIALVVAAESAAADNCLLRPNGAAPQGSHWYYRVDRAAKRNCWYVRAQSPTPAASRTASVAATSPPTETPLQPALANARAEAAAADLGQANASQPATAADAKASSESTAETAQSAVASRWLDQTAAVNRPTAEADDSAAEQAAPAPTAVADPPPETTMRPASPPAAVPTLLLVMIGALAAAALMAGIIFRFSGRRNDRQDFEHDRSAPWDRIDAEPLIEAPPLATSAPTPHPAMQRERHEAAIPAEIVQLLSKLSKEAPA